MPKVSYHSAGKVSRRHDRRCVDPRLTVTINGENFVTLDWSLGGMRIEGVPSGVHDGDELRLAFTGVRNGKRYNGEADVSVIRVETYRRHTSLHLLGLSDETFAALETLMTGLHG
jgi:hypothetical protein